MQGQETALYSVQPNKNHKAGQDTAGIASSSIIHPSHSSKQLISIMYNSVTVIPALSSIAMSPLKRSQRSNNVQGAFHSFPFKIKLWEILVNKDFKAPLPEEPVCLP